MAQTSTLKNIMERLLLQGGFGTVVPAAIGITNTTTLTLLDNYLAGPFTGASLPVGTAVKITSPADGGICTSMTTTLLTDTTKAWTVSEWINFTLRVGGFKATVTANTATTLTFAAMASAPVAGSSYTVELSESYVSGYVPSTGVVTLNPALASATLNGAQVRPQTAAFLMPKIPRFDYVKDAINRAINNRTTRWQKNPLTYVPDGDLQGAVVTDSWTGSAATPSYVSPVFPTASGPSPAPVNTERVLQSVTTNATNYVRSNLINVALNTFNTGYQWYFQTAIRVVSGTGNAQFVVWDETNNAAITTNVIYGSDTFTFVTTSLGFINIAGTCNIPSTCKQISFRLVSSATTTTIQMQQVIAYPQMALSFPIPNRIISLDFLGNYHYGTPTVGASGPFSVAFSEPITTGGMTHTYNNTGNHFTVTFNFMPLRPVYFDELTYDNELEGMADVTTFPSDQVFRWSRFELYDWLMQQEQPKFVQYASRVIPTPNSWLSRRNAALKSAQDSPYEPEMLQVLGRT